MRAFLSIALAVVAGTPAVAQDAVAGFIGDSVVAYDELGAISGRLMPSCAFALPAAVLETSSMLRVRISSSEGPVWVSSSDVIVAGLDELYQPFGVADAGEKAGGTREALGSSAPLPDGSRSLPVPADPAVAAATVAEARAAPACPAGPYPVSD
jgi:hypothetical protein